MARQTDIRLRRSAVSGSVPTTSNLNLGELALNTADGKVYMKKSVGGTDTVVEVGSGSGISASFIAYEYTATANQTTFSGSDNNSNTLAYNTGTPPSVQVFMNGILLDEGSSQDYTGTNGTSVVLTTAADAGDLIQIHAYKSDVSIVSNLNFNDNQKLQFGDSQDLQIYHDGSQSIIQDVGTGQLKILGENTIHIGSATGSHSYIRALKSGAVELYHNNVKKFETTASGVQIQGSIAATTAAYLPIIYGGSSSLQLKSNTGELFAQFTNNGATQLYHDNVKKFETTSTGVNVTGNVVADGGTIDGTFIVDGGTGVASSGIFHVRQNGNGDSNGIAITSSNATSHRIWKSASGVLNIGSSSNTNAFQQDLTGNITIEGTISAGVFTTNANTGTFSNSIGTLPLVTSTPYDYVAKFESTDAGAAIIIEDNNSTSNANRVAVSGNTMKLVTAATTALTINASQNATFAGTISSGAITSSGAIVGSSVESTGNLFGANGLHTLNTAGNGWDHTINRNGGSPSANLPGGITSGNITTTGYLRGPSTFIIDPAAHGDDTGTVVIAGNLQIDGTTTTINSTTLTVDDKNITLASGAANATAANGAGLTVDGANATWTYSLGDNAWASNKHAQFYTGDGTGTLSVGRTSDQALRLYADDNYNRIFAFQDSDTNGDHFFDLVRSFAGTGKADMRFMNGTAVHMLINKDGNVGIGTASPDYKLEVVGNTMRGDASAVTSPGFAARQNIVSSFQHGTNGIGRGGSLYLLNTNTNRESGFLSFGAYYNNTNNLYYQTGGIGGGKETAAGSGWGGYLSFWTTSDGTAGAASGQFEHMRINADGNVGIGTDAPTEKLHVVGDVSIGTGGTGGTASLKFVNDNERSRITSNYDAGGGGRLGFWTDTTGGTLLQRLTIKNSGNVGIGTDSPDSKLTVNTTTTGDGIELQSSEVSIAKLSRHVVSSTVVASLDGVAGRPIHVGGVVNEDVILANAGGKVGIGNINPAATLEVGTLTSGSTGNVIINSEGGNPPGLQVKSRTNRARINVADNDTSGYIIAEGSVLSIGFSDSLTANNLNISNSHNVGIGTTAPVAKLQVEVLGIETNQSSVTSTNQFECEAMSATAFRSARYTVQVTNVTDSTYQITEILLIHDGTTPSITEYGTIYTGSAAEASFDADITSGNVRLLATPASADNMQFKVVRHSILV